MVRFIALAAVAAAAISAPASAAEIRVSLVGKSDAQIQADVRDAARTVCRRAVQDESFKVEAFRRCLTSTVKVTMDRVQVARAGSPA